MADACVFLLENAIHDGIYNIGSGIGVTIRGLAETVMEVIAFSGTIDFDPSKPDGTPRKLLDVSRMATLGRKTKTALRDEITLAYKDLLEKLETGFTR